MTGLFYGSEERISYHDAIKYVNCALFDYLENQRQMGLFDFKKITEQFLDNVLPSLEISLMKFYLQIYRILQINLPNTIGCLVNMLSEEAQNHPTVLERKQI